MSDKKHKTPVEPDKEKTESVQQKIADLEHKLEDATTNWKRAVADYQNLERRTREEKAAFVRYATEGLIKKLLGILDTLELAARHIKDQGITLTLDEFRKVLREEGVEKIEVTGKQFDPFEMECIDSVSGQRDNEVVEELRSGYKRDGKVIRPAQVKVSNKVEKPKL